MKPTKKTRRQATKKEIAMLLLVAPIALACALVVTVSAWLSKERMYR